MTDYFTYPLLPWPSDCIIFEHQYSELEHFARNMKLKTLLSPIITNVFVKMCLIINFKHVIGLW